MVVCVVVQQQSFGCIDGRVQLWTGIQVLPVQVHTPGISPAKTITSVASIKRNPLCFAVGKVQTDERFLPVVPTNDPVWVEHRNELEDKHVSQSVSTRVISSEDEVEESVKHERRGRLPRVHPTAEKKHLDPRVKFTKTTVGIKANKV